MQSKGEKKMAAIMRAEFRLRQQLERIDWEAEVLTPKMEEFREAAQTPALPSEVLVEFVEHDPTNSNH